MLSQKHYYHYAYGKEWCDLNCRTEATPDTACADASTETSTSANTEARSPKDRKYQHYNVDAKGTAIGKAGPPPKSLLRLVWWGGSDSEASTTYDYIPPT
jgi:hypothetical protein